MSISTKDELRDRLQMTHGRLRQATEDLSDEQIAQQPGPAAPPIGWHLWHLTRWTDRLQGSFLDESSRQGLIPGTFWVEERLAINWGPNPEDVGLEIRFRCQRNFYVPCEVQPLNRAQISCLLPRE